MRCLERAPPFVAGLKSQKFEIVERFCLPFRRQTFVQFKESRAPLGGIASLGRFCRPTGDRMIFSLGHRSLLWFGLGPCRRSTAPAWAAYFPARAGNVANS